MQRWKYIGATLYGWGMTQRADVYRLPILSKRFRWMLIRVKRVGGDV